MVPTTTLGPVENSGYFLCKGYPMMALNVFDGPIILWSCCVLNHSGAREIHRRVLLVKGHRFKGENRSYNGLTGV